MTEPMRSKTQRPRSQEEIFADLRALAQSDGALHGISAIVYRDWIVGYDLKDKCVTGDPMRRWSSDKLNKNELMLLIGLLVQASGDNTYSIDAYSSDFLSRADGLLREFHDLINDAYRPVFDAETHVPVDSEELIGPLAREAIYYGAESFFQHQFAKFARLRYRDDATWLLQNVGLSIRPIVDISNYISDRVNAQISAVGRLREDGHALSGGDLTSSLLISKAELRKRFGRKADAFMAKFATPVSCANVGFTDPFAVNEALIAPLIDLGDYIYVPNQYRLYESVYESPFYWMWLDERYRPTLSAHRGTFLEKTTAYILRTVFGTENVFENVLIMDGKDRAGEIDVLVVYGEFVLIVQAKSKRVTLKARAGDVDALKNDFKEAIQSPYAQALKCANLILKKARCIAPDGKTIIFPSVPRLFPMVILSDAFPASTLLSRVMLTRGSDMAPIIWDLAVLDCVARMLPSPIELLFYLQCRAQVFDTIGSDSEFNFLGFHILHKLALSPEADFMMLHRDFAAPVDDFMVPQEIGIKVERPRGILERLSIPIVLELLNELKSADPRLSGVVVDIYDFSGNALEDVSRIIRRTRDEVRATGKAIKAFSIPTGTGGLTYAVVSRFDDASRHSAEMIGRKHKYDTRSDRWYVIVDSIETSNPVDGMLPIVFPWVEDVHEADSAARVAFYFNTRQEAVQIGHES